MSELDLSFYPHNTKPAIWTRIFGPRENPPTPGTWIWAPSPLAPLEATQGDLNRLRAAGWQYVANVEADSIGTTLMPVLGQLGQTRVVHIAGSQDDYQLWAPHTDLEQAQRTPVILAFTAPEIDDIPTDMLTLSILKTIPPPTFGTVALIPRTIENTHGYQRFTIDQLDKNTQTTQRLLALTLRILAGSNLDWLPVIEQFSEEPDAELEEYYRAIEAAHAQSNRETVREKWLETWDNVQWLAQHLADAYWAIYQSETGAPLTGLTARDTAEVVQRIAVGLLDGDKYTKDEQRQIAVRVNPLGKRGEMTITLKPGTDEGWEHVASSLSALGDDVVDTFCAHLILAADTNGTAHITDPFWVGPDDILHICERKLSNRAYTPKQRAAVVEHQQIIARAHVWAHWPGKRKGHKGRLDSAIWNLPGQTIGEYKTSTGETVWERRQMNIGEWAKLLPPLSAEAVAALRTVLKYHPQRDRYVKRLGLYLSLQFCMNAKTLEASMAVLIEQSDIIPDLKHPGETRKLIEEALARLQADNIIGEYHQVVESLTTSGEERELIEQRSRGWWELYTTIRWQIDPPQPSARLLQAPNGEGSFT